MYLNVHYIIIYHAAIVIGAKRKVPQSVMTKEDISKRIRNNDSRSRQNVLAKKLMENSRSSKISSHSMANK